MVRVSNLRSVNLWVEEAPSKPRTAKQTMFELATTDTWWRIAKFHPQLSNHSFVLKPCGSAQAVHLIEKYACRRALEIGHGGHSFVYNIAAPLGIELWGLDRVHDGVVSQADIDQLKVWHPNVRYVEGLLGQNQSELPEGYFDILYSISVLEHIPHDELHAAFAEAFRLLRPGGIFFHSYDVYFGMDLSPVFLALQGAGFEWLKPVYTMNVFWESWLPNWNENSLHSAFGKILLENPMCVAEQYMHQIPRPERPAPVNYFSVMCGARKPKDGRPAGLQGLPRRKSMVPRLRRLLEGGLKVLEKLGL